MTIIVPTMWYGEGVHETIQQVRNNSALNLVLVDNRDLGYIEHHDRIRWVKLGCNLMVNQSWNLGANLFADDLLCLLNDDLEVNLSLLNRHARIWFRDDPRLAMAHFNDACITGRINSDSDSLGLRYTGDFPLGYGCLLIIRRSMYQSIPPSLKVFYGDDYLRWRYRHVLFLETAEIIGIEAKGSLSMTASRPEFAILLNEERKLFEEEMKNANQSSLDRCC